VRNPTKNDGDVLCLCVDGLVAVERACVVTAVNAAIMLGAQNVVKMETRSQMSRMNWKVAQVAFVAN
jgi:hypothetical protein